MLTRAYSEREPLDLHAQLRRAQALFSGDLRKVGLRKPKLVGKTLGRTPRACGDKRLQFHSAHSVEDTKPTCQQFAISRGTKDTKNVNVTDIRRERLRAWFANRTLPPREKSYLSQLMGGKSSFGEKAARRLEQTYGMPPMYIDTPADGTTPAQPLPAFTPDQLMIATVWPHLPQEKKDELLEQMASDRERYKALLDALLTEVSARTVSVRPKTHTPINSVRRGKKNAA